MVEDPFLVKHLSHFGINVSTLEKTEKSMAELEVTLNQRFGEWSTIQESGAKLQPLYGPGYTGLQNLGNSCYMNSVLQVFFSIPDFQKKYFANGISSAMDNFRNSTIDPSGDFNAQTSKIAFGLLSGRYSEPPEEEVEDQDEAQPGIRPLMYKNLIGKGHPEFSTKRQQDAQEFLLHMINLIERHSRGSKNPSDCFKFKTEDRLECSQSNRVRYTERDEYCLPLTVPMDLLTNREEVEEYKKKELEAKSRNEKLEMEPVRPHFTMMSLLQSFTQPEIIHQFYSSAINAKTTAYKTTRFATFPDYLAIQLRKFALTDDWRPYKLDISVAVPDVLDISFLRGSGLKPGEQELPSDVQVPEFVYDATIMQSLMEMGFPVEGCKRSIYFTENKGIEPAAMWAMEHMGDADFDKPFVIPGTEKKNADVFVPNEEAIAMIEAMGFSRAQACVALKSTDNNTERAADWIFSHPEEVSNADSSVPAPNEVTYRDGAGKYELFAFISHMGTSTSCGHYVCHVKKDGRWVIFNDNKVALSEHPPIELGYLYFFKRI
ncbi:hypothetical protein QYM36_015797 [Artemia franciscana]|nr:hypothetical protein QYM36_015797 [Artemia franciscana]